MIPERILLDEAYFDIPESHDERASIHRDGEDGGGLVEFIRPPIAKKFSEEKPKENGRYWIIFEDGRATLDIWVYDKWQSGNSPIYWCEIITPKLPE